MNWSTKKLKGALWRAGVNGCGVCGVRPPFFDKFQACCELHDAMYNEGGDGKARFRADKRLIVDMVNRSMGTWLMMWCFVYYVAVRMFGWLFFNYKASPPYPSPKVRGVDGRTNNSSTFNL